MACLASDETGSMKIREGKVRETYEMDDTKYSSISQDMLETAQECVEAMNNEVVGLRERFARTSQEAKEKLQQENPAGSSSS